MEIYKENRDFIITILFWTITGMYLGPVIYGVIPISLMIYKNKDKYQEILIGFFYILILSDSRQPSLAFAADVKNIYVVIMTLFLLFDKKVFAPINNIYQQYIPFFILAYICIFYSPSDIVLTAIEKTTSYFFLILVVPNYIIKCYRDKGDYFFKILIYFAAAILATGFVLRVIHPSQTLLEERYRGMLGNPNGLGVFSLLFFLLFSLTLNVFPKLFERKERIAIYSLIIISIVLCGSRSSLFAIIIYLFFSYFYKFSSFLGFIFFLVIAGSYQYISDHIVDVIESLGLTKYLRASTITEASGRFAAWRFAIENIKNSVFIGHGFEYTNDLFEKNWRYLSALGHQGNAHNSYITLWLDTGLIGLILYLVAMFSQFIRTSRKNKLSIPILYTVVFCTFFESWLTSSLNPFTIQLFIIISILTSDSIISQKATVAIPV